MHRAPKSDLDPIPLELRADLPRRVRRRFDLPRLIATLTLLGLLTIDYAIALVFMLRHPDPQNMSSFTVFFLFPVAGVIILTLIWRQAKVLSVRSLIANGQATRGQIIDRSAVDTRDPASDPYFGSFSNILVEVVWSALGLNHQYTIAYTFHDAPGQARQAKMSVSRRDYCTSFESPEITVIFKAADPTKSTIYELCPYRALIP